MRKGAWSKGDPTLAFELGSWVVVGPYLVENSRLASETQHFGSEVWDACKVMGGKEVLPRMGFPGRGPECRFFPTSCFLFLPCTWWPILSLHIPMSTLRICAHGIWPPPR